MRLERTDAVRGALPSAVFFDLAGTLVTRRPESNTPPVLLPGVREAAERLPGVPLFIVTNLTEVTHRAGDDGSREVERLFTAVYEHLGGRITAARCCPHPAESICAGHKPAPGGIAALAAEHQVDLARAWYVGDTLLDRECARRAGVGQFHWAQSFFPFWIAGGGKVSEAPGAFDFPIQNPNAQTRGPAPRFAPPPEIQNARVRPAIEADLPSIVRIYNEAIAERISTCDLEPVTVAARRPWFERFDARHPLHVAVVGEEVIGWSALLPYDPKPGYAGVVEHSLYVARAARGAGLGRCLLEHLIRAAAALGHRCMLGRIFRHNDPSLALHHRLGFEEAGVLPRAALLDGREADVVFMLRHL
jgi:phosphinothricin acetyltransferase